MTRNFCVTIRCGATAILALGVLIQGCKAETPDTSVGSGGAMGTGGGSSTGGASNTATGGSSGTGGATISASGGRAGTGGATISASGGRAGTGGATGTGTGGGAPGTGGATISVTGGRTGSGGTTGTGTGGAIGIGTGGNTSSLLSCNPVGTTGQDKGAPCTSPGFTCTKTCGPPLATGALKTETCTAGILTDGGAPTTVYVEGYCVFPPGDYACYKVTPTTPACPAGTATSAAFGTNTCTAPAICNGNSAPCIGYTDSTGVIKANGYCVCYAGRWACGSGPSGVANPGNWPCLPNGTSASPGGTGC